MHFELTFDLWPTSDHLFPLGFSKPCQLSKAEVMTHSPIGPCSSPKSSLTWWQISCPPDHTWPLKRRRFHSRRYPSVSKLSAPDTQEARVPSVTASRKQQEDFSTAEKWKKTLTPLPVWHLFPEICFNARIPSRLFRDDVINIHLATVSPCMAANPWQVKIRRKYPGKQEATKLLSM